ncbi:MAG TPA: hypothetical protein VFE25_00400 [Opitutaceae bacterium]|nr:hypothetical protein [Opitutaceae bacterium]
MKHLTWILFTVFCSAFVQVQPVSESKACTKCVCCQCQVPGSCGAPCTHAPSQAPLVFSAQERSGASRSVARRATAAKPAEKKFYSSYAGAPSETAALAHPVSAGPAATDPLFVVQCRFLI